MVEIYDFWTSDEIILNEGKQWLFDNQQYYIAILINL